MTALSDKGLGLLKVSMKIAGIFLVIVSVFAFTRDGGKDEAAVVTTPDQVAQPDQPKRPLAAFASPGETLED